MMKKTIIQRYREESVSPLNQLEIDHFDIFSNYTQRLLLTRIYSNPSPPILTPIQKLNMVSIKDQEPIPIQFQMGNISLINSSLADIQLYVKSITNQWESVLSFFFSQHCKRSKQFQQVKSTINGISNPHITTTQIEEIENRQNLESYHSLLISGIYYADLFVRNQIKKPQMQNNSNISVIEILIISISITIKFWMEEKMSVNKYLSEIFCIPIKRINEIEIYFLELINYQIYLSEKDIQIFSNIIYKCHLNNNKQQQQYINSNILPPTAISSPESTPQQILFNNTATLYNTVNINNQQQYIQIHSPSSICINLNNSNNGNITPSSNFNTPNCLSSSTINTPIYSSPNIVSYYPHAAPTSTSSPITTSPFISSSISSPVSSPLSCKSPQSNVKYIPKTPNSITNSASANNSPCKSKSFIHSTNNNSNQIYTSNSLLKPRYIITSSNLNNTTGTSSCRAISNNIKVSRSLHQQQLHSQHHNIYQPHNIYSTHNNNINNTSNNNIIIIVPQKF